MTDQKRIEAAAEYWTIDGECEVSDTYNAHIESFLAGVKWRDAHPSPDVQATPNQDFFIVIIELWKHFWMHQTQNSEEDRQNYFSRAFGVDANMKHDLARRCYEALAKWRARNVD